MNEYDMWVNQHVHIGHMNETSYVLTRSPPMIRVCFSNKFADAGNIGVDSSSSPNKLADAVGADNQSWASSKAFANDGMVYVGGLILSNLMGGL